MLTIDVAVTVLTHRHPIYGDPSPPDLLSSENRQAVRVRLVVDADVTSDAKLYLDPEGVPVVAVSPDLLSPHAENVIRQVLLLLGEHFGEVRPYPVEVPVGHSADHFD